VWQKVDQLVEVSLEVRWNDYRAVVDASSSDHSDVVILRRVGGVIQQRIAYRYAHVVPGRTSTESAKTYALLQNITIKAAQLMVCFSSQKCQHSHWRH